METKGLHGAIIGALLHNGKTHTSLGEQAAAIQVAIRPYLRDTKPVSSKECAVVTSKGESLADRLNQEFLQAMERVDVGDICDFSCEVKKTEAGFNIDNQRMFKRVDGCLLATGKKL